MASKNKKEALLQAAKELFGECGYVETTFKKISDRAGVALGLLTHHYGNKEKLFLASGLDVLENFLVVLRESSMEAHNGFEAVMCFCKAYLDFSVDKNSNWLVLVRCSPYSDMKTKTDRDLMDSMFSQVHSELEGLIARGISDGSIAKVERHHFAHGGRQPNAGTHSLRPAGSVRAGAGLCCQSRKSLIHQKNADFGRRFFVPAPDATYCSGTPRHFVPRGYHECRTPFFPRCVPAG